jgi:hypothetical protein
MSGRMRSREDGKLTDLDSKELFTSKVTVLSLVFVVFHGDVVVSKSPLTPQTK